MQIKELRVRRYRAFDKEVIVPLSSMTVLTGPNNLGKSTVLSALNMFFSYFGARDRVKNRLSKLERYSFERDYPKRYAGKMGRRWPTVIKVQIEFSDNDRNQIMPTDPKQIPSLLTISLAFEFNQEYQEYSPILNFAPPVDREVRRSIIVWIRNNVRYIYIPATRNVETFKRQLFTELVSGALSRVSRSKQRLLAIQNFHKELVHEINELSNELAEEVRIYLPSTKDIKFKVDDLDLNNLLSLNDVEIDDGALTQLHLKGDGFKSLFAISFLQYIVRQRFGKNILFGIEEPESHLHSSAIYEIKSSLRSLSESFQVIITTHSPILIQRDDISSNVIVEEANVDGFASTAKRAIKITDIRKSLGIRPQENLATAEIVVVVEGLTEERVLPQIIRILSQEVFEAISNGRIRILSANSASNIPAVIRALARDVTTCLVLADNDDEGRNAVNRLRNSGLIPPADIFLVAQRNACKDTEFEDLFDPDLYFDAVGKAAGIILTKNQLIHSQKISGGKDSRMSKWSIVLENIASAQGKDWPSVKEGVRDAFASAIINNADKVQRNSLTWLQGLVAQLSRYLKEIQ